MSTAQHTQEQPVNQHLEPIDLDAIETRAAAATKGPWFATTDGTDANVPIVFVNRTTPKGVTYSSVLWNADWATKADGEFTAHARTDIPAMAAEIRRLRAELATVRTDALNEGAAAIDHLRATMLAPPVADLYANGLSRAAGELRRLAAAEEAHVVADAEVSQS